ncbi:MAG: lysine--tRNA ligase [Candidatus Omnitrophica bacterium]|nr:lysine--tRNA ligase [Candidatus Omnitrophota bacterium]
MEGNDQTKNRREKLAALQQQGLDPFGQTRFEKDCSIKALVEGYAEGKSVSTAGRLCARRSMGKLYFADLRDATGKIQVCVKQEHVGQDGFQRFGECDLGDILGVAGTLFKTKTGEITIQVERFQMLAKALRPLPEKWHGLKDVEIRYRKRYLDLIANEPVRQIFLKRSELVKSLRATLERQRFIEVETPMMHDIPGGAAGEPFKTHHNALDIDLYLRLAPELYLKRLLVGGLDRVYEINRSFRNEGLSTRHNPEFTMLEAYQAYGNIETMMRLVEELICAAAKAVIGSVTFDYQGKPVDLSPPWDRASFAETMEAMGLTPTSSQAQIQRVLESKGMKVKGLTRSQLVRLVEQLFEPKARAKPLFVTDYWTELSPLAKSQPDQAIIADRFELFIGGMEVANAYSELNDPIEQRRRFEAQLEGAQGSRLKAQGESKKQASLQPSALNLERRIDEDFIEALEYGMPPAGGLGVGVDRLAMLLLNQASIKDVILFPLLRPDAGS